MLEVLLVLGVFVPFLLVPGGRLGPVVMSLASQVEGPRFESQARPGPIWSWAAFFPSGPRWQMWLEHRASYYMPSNHYMHVNMYACWEVRQSLAEGWQFLWGTPVSSPNKNDRHDMTYDVESGVKSINPSGPRWQMWLEHRSYHYMPPRTAYIKLTATIWHTCIMLKVTLNTNQSNLIGAFLHLSLQVGSFEETILLKYSSWKVLLVTLEK